MPHCAGHALDQKRLQQPLYRHPWDDVRTDPFHHPQALLHLVTSHETFQLGANLMHEPLCIAQVLYTK